MPAEIHAFVGAGSNLCDRLTLLEFALRRLDAEPCCHVLSVSPWYQSKAVGPGVQDDYLNGVIKLGTKLSPLALLDVLLSIENAAGRKRGVRWGPRTLDLDLLLYADMVLNDARLTLPHPRIAERNFVVYPLHDLAPSLILPGGVPVARLVSNLGDQGIRRLTGGQSKHIG